MSPRIKELAEQCYEYKAEMLDIWFNKEKFAELIVRECIGMVENEAGQYAEPVWAVELVNDIRDRFGVE